MAQVQPLRTNSVRHLHTYMQTAEVLLQDKNGYNWPIRALIDPAASRSIIHRSILRKGTWSIINQSNHSQTIIGITRRLINHPWLKATIMNRSRTYSLDALFVLATWLPSQYDNICLPYMNDAQLHKYERSLADKALLRNPPPVLYFQMILGRDLLHAMQFTIMDTYPCGLTSYSSPFGTLLSGSFMDDNSNVQMTPTNRIFDLTTPTVTPAKATVIRSSIPIKKRLTLDLRLTTRIQRNQIDQNHIWTYECWYWLINKSRHKIRYIISPLGPLIPDVYSRYNPTTGRRMMTLSHSILYAQYYRAIHTQCALSPEVSQYLTRTLESILYLHDTSKPHVPRINLFTNKHVIHTHPQQWIPLIRYILNGLNDLYSFPLHSVIAAIETLKHSLLQWKYLHYMYAGLNIRTYNVHVIKYMDDLVGTISAVK